MSSYKFIIYSRHITVFTYVSDDFNYGIFRMYLFINIQLYASIELDIAKAIPAKNAKI